MKKKLQSMWRMYYSFRKPALVLLVGWNIAYFSALGQDLSNPTINSKDLLSKDIRQKISMVDEKDPFSAVDETEEITVSGRVTVESDGSALPGANILVKGSNLGTISDIDGNFNITAPNENDTLVFSYVGFVPQEVPINGRNRINIAMSSTDVELSELIVIGYGTRKKSDLTGSVARVTTEELEAVPVYNVEQALNGRAPGVTVQQNSGEPGGRVQVRIRGGNSMIGSNDPLYVVDGFPITGGIEFLNPSDIESIDILKDASATAIYGTRGANGVVIITTKGGKKGQKGRIEVNSFYGTQEEIERYEVLDAMQYVTVANEWAKNEGIAPFFDADTIQSPGTDWQDLIFRSAPIQSHTATFSGGSDYTNYSFSTNFYQQDGIIENTGVKRGSMRFNLNHEVNDRVNFGVNVTLSRREVNELDVNGGNFGGRIYTDALSAPPTLASPFDANGDFFFRAFIELPTYSFVSLDVLNPLIHTRNKERTLSNGVLANSFVEFNIIDGLTFRSRFGLEYENSILEEFQPVIFPSDLGFAKDGYVYRNSFLNENILSYTKTFSADHEITLVGGFTAQNFNRRFESSTVLGLASNSTENFDLAAASIINAPDNGISEWTLFSWLGRANYSYKGKYLLTASIRTDGSSRFGADNKWATFPSGAIAWRISQEPFMQEVGFIDDLKIRASYGVTGNTALSPYQSLDRLRSTRVVIGDEEDEVGYVPDALANADLQWETTTQLDVGFDLIVGNVELTFDYYKKNTDKLLASVPLPFSVGFSSALKNIGEVQNSGIELGISATIVRNDFKWNIYGQFAANDNEVKSLAGESDIFGSENSHPFNEVINIARIGEPLGVFYGLVEDGLDEDGLIKFTDIDGNGTINALDRVILGSPYPDFTYGLNNNFSYKGFDLNVFLQGVQGRDLFWETAGVHLNSFQRGQNQLADLFGNYWTEDNPNPNAKYPKISSSTVARVSDRYIKDASYLRVKLIKLGYNLPVDNLKWITRAQVYVSGVNLFTFTDYPGVDPEVNVTGTDSQNIGDRLKVGIDESAYPSAKIYSVGLNLGF